MCRRVVSHLRRFDDCIYQLKHARSRVYPCIDPLLALGYIGRQVRLERLVCVVPLYAQRHSCAQVRQPLGRSTDRVVSSGCCYLRQIKGHTFTTRGATASASAYPHAPVSSHSSRCCCNHGGGGSFVAHSRLAQQLKVTQGVEQYANVVHSLS